MFRVYLNMQVINQPKINNSIYTPHFTSNLRNVYDETGKFLYKTSSSFFRPDLEWNKLTDMLIRKYKDANKVNIHCTGCSEGAEPFSLAMLLIEKLGEQGAQKFFPIKASDINAQILENPKKGVIHLSEQDIRYIKDILGENYSRYIEFSKKAHYSKEDNTWLYRGKIKPILNGKVIFSNRSISSELKYIEKGNNVLICRNFWSYYPENEQSKLAKDIFDKLDENSVCIIGEDDDYISKVGGIPKMKPSQFVDDDDFKIRYVIDETNMAMSKASFYLRKAGFLTSKIPYCFTKEHTKPNHLSDPQFLMNTFAVKN